VTGCTKQHPTTCREQVEAYFPPGVWYSLWDDQTIDAGEKGLTKTLPAPLGDVPVHARGGSIVPAQRPALVTRDVRTSPLRLLVHLPTGRVSRSCNTILAGKAISPHADVDLIPPCALAIEALA